MQDEKLNYQKMSDKDLIQRFCDDPPDHTAFETLWARYEQKILKYARCLSFMHPHFYSQKIFEEDIFSKTQEQVVKKIGGFKGNAQFSTWLYSIVKNAALAHRRDLRKERSKKGLYDQVPLTDEAFTYDSEVFRDKLKQDPLHHLKKSEFRAKVKEVLFKYVGSKKGWHSYRVVCLYGIDNCPVPQIVQLLGIHERTVYRRRDHDYKALRAACMQAGMQKFFEP
jgi:RNA polymerase sigma factor (sigma-70 family)